MMKDRVAQYEIVLTTTFHFVRDGSLLERAPGRIESNALGD
jgi:hypothetical protein